MAALVENKQGFKVILMEDANDLAVCGFGDICDSCGESVRGACYYVPVLDFIMCEKCYEEWIAKATRYEVDIPYETRKFNYIAQRLWD